MKNKAFFSKRILNIIFLLFLAIVLIVVPFATDLFGTGYKGELRQINDGWVTESGETVNIDDVRTGDLEGDIILERKLPEDISELDDLCFQSQNCNVKVWVNGRESYSFSSKENLTGHGYGRAFHEVGISTSDGGKNLRMIMSKVHKDGDNGRVDNVYICSSSDYFLMNVRRIELALIVSVLIIFFSLVTIIVNFWISDKASLPFNLAALGTTTFIIGMWLLLDTGIFQLVSGSIYVWRDIKMTVLFLLGYPMVCFVNSLSKQKNRIYELAAFWVSILFLIVIVGLRYLFDMDMMVSFSRSLVTYAVIIMALILGVFIDNLLYCKKLGVDTEMRTFVIGIMIFMVCCMVDFVKFFSGAFSSDSSGNYMRLGMLAFIVLMLVQFMKWWTKDHYEIERDRFINRALQYAISSDTPEERIDSMLAFLGKEFEARRIYIFEDQKNDKFRGTYEWCREGLEKVSVDMLYIPYKGVLDKVYDLYKKNNERLIVQDIEIFREDNPVFYNILKTNNVRNIVIGPLVINRRLTGFCAVYGAPAEKMSEIAEIISLISYFLGQLTLQREEQNRLFYYSYCDALTGTRNHRAYRKFIEQKLDTSTAFGYFRCFIRGLEEANAQGGYEAGDKMVVLVGRCLMEVFGESNVYRMNGTEFAVFGFESDEGFFDNDVDRATKMIAQKGVDLFVGSVYCLNGTNDIMVVQNRVEEILREQIRKSKK